jgi:hypothetical protein
VRKASGERRATKATKATKAIKASGERLASGGKWASVASVASKAFLATPWSDRKVSVASEGRRAKLASRARLVREVLKENAASLE